MDLQSFPHVYVFREKESAGGFVPAGKDGGMGFLPPLPYILALHVFLYG